MGGEIGVPVPVTETFQETIALVSREPYHGVRYVSGLTIYEEALVDGRWIGRYWSTNGRIRPDMFIDGPNHDAVQNLPIEAFELEIDGQVLTSYWEWVDARIESIPVSASS